MSFVIYPRVRAVLNLVSALVLLGGWVAFSLIMCVSVVAAIREMVGTRRLGRLRLCDEEEMGYGGGPLWRNVKCEEI